ncbi:MAG: IS630 family transposase [Chloroflexi bacterium]|nr:IS630 family transposase [Chloroflexota bacterium]
MVLGATNAKPLSAAHIRLTGSEKRLLGRIARAHTSEQRMALRAKIILLANLGRNNCEIADELAVCMKTVRKWRSRFSLHRMEGLYDEPRSGRPFTFGTSVRHEVFTAVVGPPPEPYARWNLDLLAKHLIDDGFVPSISLETLSYWLRTADIKPHRVRGWLNSKDPRFREKRDRIVNLYLNPPKDGRVLSFDEKTSIQARERIRQERAVQPGQPRRMEWEYKRHGIVNLLASFDVRTGKIVHHEFVEKNNSAAFIGFLKKLMKLYPTGKLYLVLDNGSTHCSRETRAFLAENERLVPVYTPTHASWLNQVEIWFSVMAKHVIHHVSFKSREQLRTRIAAYIELHNRELAMPYEWSTKGKPLTGATAKARRRSRNNPRGSRKAARC